MTARGLLQIDAHRQHCRHSTLIGSQRDQALPSAWLPRGRAQPPCRARGADTLRSRLHTCFRHAYLVRPCRLLYTCLWHENTHSDACPRGQQQPHPGNRAPGFPPLHRQLARTRPSMPGIRLCARTAAPQHRRLHLWRHAAASRRHYCVTSPLVPRRRMTPPPPHHTPQAPRRHAAQAAVSQSGDSAFCTEGTQSYWRSHESTYVVRLRPRSLCRSTVMNCRMPELYEPTCAPRARSGGRSAGQTRQRLGRNTPRMQPQGSVGLALYCSLWLCRSGSLWHCRFDIGHRIRAGVDVTRRSLALRRRLGNEGARTR